MERRARCRCPGLGRASRYVRHVRPLIPPDKSDDVGESLAGFNPSLGVSAPGERQSLWVDEKKNYHGQPIPFTAQELEGPPPYPLHYTQMVWQNTTEVGCGIAADSTGSLGFSILVCRYFPGGNYPRVDAVWPSCSPSFTR